MNIPEIGLVPIPPLQPSNLRRPGGIGPYISAIGHMRHFVPVNFKVYYDE